jgi:hypothetical protein
MKYTNPVIFGLGLVSLRSAQRPEVKSEVMLTSEAAEIT